MNNIEMEWKKIVIFMDIFDVSDHPLCIWGLPFMSGDKRFLDWAKPKEWQHHPNTIFHPKKVGYHPKRARPTHRGFLSVF